MLTVWTITTVAHTLLKYIKYDILEKSHRSMQNSIWSWGQAWILSVILQNRSSALSSHTVFPGITAAAHLSPRRWRQQCCQMTRWEGVAHRASNRRHALLQNDSYKLWGIVHFLLHPTPAGHRHVKSKQQDIVLTEGHKQIYNVLSWKLEIDFTLQHQNDLSVFVLK